MIPPPEAARDQPLAEASGHALEAPYLSGLNDEQRGAVLATEGPVLVLAGAGTGKTRVLTTRLAHILVKGRAQPWEILAVTFTNKAAREMKDRVSALIGGPVEGWWLGTFHALGARILRSHAEAVGLKPNFTILDADDQHRLLKQILAASEVDDKRWPARMLLAVIQRWKDRGLGPDKVASEPESDMVDGRLMELYQSYQDRLRTLNAVDFGDLLLHCLALFTGNPEVLERYQRRIRYILVDEYQDTNVAQYLWLRLLARTHKNICCVGDDDQSIYSWRGAEVGNILKFEKDFEGAQVIRLERNYRSTSHILGAASGLIAQNEGRLGKTLWTDDAGGEKIVVQGVWDGEEEARVVGDEIETRHAQGRPLNDIAVLVRAGFQMREFEERMITLGIPYRVIGGPRFYERQEIRDAVAYLRMVASPDDDLAFERIVNVPKRGLGKATLKVIHELARAQTLPLLAAARALTETDELRPKARAALTRLTDDFQRWRAEMDQLPHVELAALILDESGYTEMWQKDKTPEAPGRLENLRELVAGLGEFENLQGFLEHVSLVMENEENTSDDKVNLMTLHAAKGLEFDTVFLPGWEDGLFPHQRAMDENGTQGLEEERRLAYVGLTRARKEARILFVAHRRVYNQWQNPLPSRFVDELPAAHLEVRSAEGVYGAAGLGGAASFDFNRVRAPRARRQTALIDGEAWASVTPGPESAFAAGSRVFHQKFGYGRVQAADGDKLEVAFEKAGTKKVLASFVAPA